MLIESESWRLVSLLSVPPSENPRPLPEAYMAAVDLLFLHGPASLGILLGDEQRVAA